MKKRSVSRVGKSGSTMLFLLTMGVTGTLFCSPINIHAVLSITSLCTQGFSKKNGDPKKMRPFIDRRNSAMHESGYVPKLTT